MLTTFRGTWRHAGVLLLCLFVGNAAAGELATPEGRVILRVTGNVSTTNDGDGAAFDRAMLAGLEQVTIVTTTPWTEGETTFRGPLARDVLAAAGADGASIAASAINDYTVTIPMSDLRDYPVILAIERDGKALRVRDRGPIWVIYPWSEHPELVTEIVHGRSI